MHETATRTSYRRSIIGVALGLAAAVAFGAGGAVIKPLFGEGWSPAAAVLARITVAAMVLAIPALTVIRGDLRVLWRVRGLILTYALIAVVGTQLAFYSSIERIPVSFALLIEYLAPVALLLLAWVRSRKTPHRVVLTGAGLALAGLVLVIGPNGAEALDPVGVLIAAIAMVGVAVYYVVGEKADNGVPPVTLAWAGFTLGAVVLGVAGLVGLFPIEMTFGTADFFGVRSPWWVPIAVVGIVSTAFAYVAGITAITLLGTRLASFLGLSEVVFAGIVGWIFLGEAIGVLGLVGAVLILTGVVLIRHEPPQTAGLSLAEEHRGSSKGVTGIDGPAPSHLRDTSRAPVR